MQIYVDLGIEQNSQLFETDNTVNVSCKYNVSS